METVTLNVVNRNIKKLYDEVRLIRNIVSEEYELSDWAKKELREARAIPESELISHEEVRKRILKK